MKKYLFLGVTTILNNNAVVPIDKTQVFSTVDSIRKCFVLEHSYLQLSPNQFSETDHLLEICCDLYL